MIVTIYLTGGKNVTGNIKNDFCFLKVSDGNSITTAINAVSEGYEVINIEQVMLMRPAFTEEIEYYNTHGLGRKKVEKKI